ncbi:hypothetical protein GCM10027202_17510 [Microvirgula curvata]
MKTYKRGRTSSEFIAAAQAAGMEIETTNYNLGGDWITAHGTLESVAIRMLFNVCTAAVIGNYGEDGRPFATEDGSHDGEPWFDAVLDLAMTNEPPQRT